MEQPKKVIIYQKTKNALQSGLKNTALWHIKFNDSSLLDTGFNYDTMNWSGSCNTLSQVNISFITLQQAIDFAEKNDYSYEIHEASKARNIVAKSYADNFTL